MEFNKPAYISFIDLAKAFDFPGLWNVANILLENKVLSIKYIFLYLDVLALTFRGDLENFSNHPRILVKLGFGVN